MRKDLIEAQIVLGRGKVKEELQDFIRRNAWKKIFLVAGKSFSELPIGKELKELQEEMGFSLEVFSEFSVNPDFTEALKGAEVFRSYSGDVIFAAGGGSAMDTAKAIKLFSAMPEEEILKKPWQDNGIPLLAIPTTAGTGSESTPFSVLYKDGEKISLEDESIYPLVRVEDERSLKSLPLFQKKVTVLDALSHAMESIWSKSSAGDNLYYGKEAIERILRYADDFFQNEETALKEIAYAANMAGKAIAITKTTGGHALSYKLGGLFSLPHGLAVAMVNKELYPLLAEKEKRKEEREKLSFLARCFSKDTVEGGVEAYLSFLDKMEILASSREFFLERMDYAVLGQENPVGSLDKNPAILEKAVELLTKSVNLERLQNHPMALSEEEIAKVYRAILLLDR